MQLQPGAAFVLPEPDEESTAHSQRVAAYIRECIADEGGSIGFAEFMQHALYAPGLGYYVSGTKKFGAGGDFVTAPEISPLFGRVLASQIATALQQLDEGRILELGAGSGALASCMLQKLAELDVLPDQYCILEVSPELAKRQQECMAQQVPGFIDRVRWLAQMPRSFTGVIVANEVADALPVERFVRRGAALNQLRVGVQNESFRWIESIAPESLRAAIVAVEDELGRQFADGYRSEICLALPHWVGELAGCLHKGLVLLFDYGATRKEYYARDRHDGWLRCHYRHRAHDDPLILPGIQDLTAAVDFTAIAAAGIDAGAEIAGFVTQAHFLLSGGLADELDDWSSLSVASQAELSRQVKLLTLPGEMGENLKCIGIGRGDIAPLAAFGEFDRTHML